MCFGGGKIFITLDLTQAYQQLNVNEPTPALMINTIRGSYKVKRLPFGLLAGLCAKWGQPFPKLTTRDEKPQLLLHHAPYHRQREIIFFIIYAADDFEQKSDIRNRPSALTRPHKPLAQTLSPRMTQWCIIMLVYDYELVHCTVGKKHQNADALSRLWLDATNHPHRVTCSRCCQALE